MSAPILTTKLYIPPPRPELISRSHLIERLNEGLHRKLTFISAPAGFGKTTLVSHWLQQLNMPAGWLSLDEFDNDPIRFLIYFIAALQQVNPDIGLTIQTTLQSPQPLPSNSLLPLLINDLATLPNKIVLVLDDYHLIEAKFIHADLNFLLDHLPPQLHLVITSRADPPFPLARLRAHDQMTELREDDLRFTAAEAVAFLNEVMGLNLSAEDVATLETRTEGWVAGLQLAALSIQRQQDPSGFITAFAGDDHYIVDYLAAEVLNQQPEETQRFLLQTSILNRMNGPLCNAVTGSEDGQVMLETLQQANLFVIPLDNKRRWYRYHHLFAEFLHNQLQHMSDLRKMGESDEPVSHKNREYLAELHHRASHWYEQNGFTAEAIEHGLAAGDSNQVATLLEKHADQLLWQSGHISALLRWLDALPEAMVRTRPRLAITKAAILVESFTDPLETVEGLLQAAETVLQAEGRSGNAPAENGSNNRQALLTEIDIIRASLARYHGDIARSIELIRQALERVPKDNVFLREGATQMLAIAQSSLGQMGEARRIFAGALKINQAAGDSYGLTLATAYLVEVLTVQGQLQQAKQVFREVLPAIGERHSPDVGMVYINIGEVFREWDQLGAADHYLRQGIELCQPFEAFAAMVVTGHITLARVLQAQGNLTDALNLLRSAPPLRESDTIYYPSARLAAYQARLWLAQGNLTAATYWAQNSGLRLEAAPGDYRYEIDYLTLARILMAQQNFDEATVLLARLQQAAEAGERMGRVIEILMLKALTYQAQNKLDQALTDLKQALMLAEPEGYIRLFIDEGEPMARLLRQAISQGIALNYAATLRAAYKGEQKTASTVTPPLYGTILAEPLSERELEVLRLIAQGMTNREAAEKLVIATSTVKKHLENIYSKLNVNNRTQAIAQARALKLLN